MPNGGVPLQMAIKPKDGDVVLYCYGSTVKVIRWEDWVPVREFKNRPTLATLTPEEARVLVRFLRYWLGDESDDPIHDEAFRKRLGEPLRALPGGKEPIDVIYDW